MLKKNIKYIVVFIYAILSLTLFFFSRNIIDSIWNYCFSSGFVHGQIPYKDIQVIVPFLYNFIMSLGLFIWDNNLMFLIEQAILITICFYFLYKMYKEKAWLFLIFLTVPDFFSAIPTYNFFLIFLLIIVIYLEKKGANDYLIGFFLGCLILTKHTVGIFFVIPTFILYFKDLKKIGKRALGCLAPWIIFLIYLLIANNLWEFIDLCILGLFDFASSNSNLLSPYFFVSIICSAIIIYFIVKKDSKNYVYWYCLFAGAILLPIFNRYHFRLYLLFFSIFIMEVIPFFKHKWIIPFYTFLICFCCVLSNFILTGVYKRIERLDGINHFEYYIGLKGTKNSITVLNELYNKYKLKGKTKILSDNTMFIEVINDEKFDYFSEMNFGNYGYNGTERLIKKIKNKQYHYFIIDMDKYTESKLRKYNKYGEITQFDYIVVDYIMNNFKEIEDLGMYKVYYHE